ncbi:LysM peptidoglycan-binding domain-containing protein [Cohnella faecalis]|uniref:LysM peptidoglycan-binding domain-containing protein n=1 Tax=Cohnella faecalis TaxID=2315694 RepID=A0A398CP64_9BACL|nr:LysM peptidoglycan-binding domain-containing protein [Cohnella faecalis]
MEYSIQLSFNNGDEKLKIPILPEILEIKGSGNGKTYTVVGLGEINVITARSLKGISFSSFFPAVNYPILQETKAVFLMPAKYVQTIERWMATKRPIRFVFSGHYDINIPVSIESFEWSEIAGSGGDIEYKIELKEYRFYAAQTVTINKKTVSKKPARPNEKQVPKTYKLVAGDSLYKVAQKILGDASRWPEIQKLNGIKDAQLKSLQIGMVIKLPS